MNYKILESHISESEIKYYEDINPGWTVKTTNCLLVTFEDGTSRLILSSKVLGPRLICAEIVDHTMKFQ